MNKSARTFAIALTGGGVHPEKVTVRTLSEILSAVQTLVSGRDEEPDEDKGTDEVPVEPDALSLIGVRKGSAVFPCVSRRLGALENLKRVGRFLSDPQSVEDDRFAFGLRPTKILSNAARHLDCRMGIRPLKGHDVAVITPDTYKEVSSSLLVSGPSTVSGIVQRVGGATDTRCTLRIPGRERLLYCDVANSEIARKLGDRLYEEVVVNGTATWFQRSWTLYGFRITDMNTLKRPKLLAAMKSIWEAGGNGWDSIDNPEQAIRELRS